MEQCNDTIFFIFISFLVPDLKGMISLNILLWIDTKCKIEKMFLTTQHKKWKEIYECIALSKVSTVWLLLCFILLYFLQA